MFSRRQESASADATELCKALIILFSARWQVFNGLVNFRTCLEVKSHFF
jgi:hypothetical protein